MVRLPLSALELLVAIDSYQSLSSAARHLGLSQPAASARLNRLERASALRLVKRSPRGSSLTEDGEIMAVAAREVIAASDRFERQTSALRSRGQRLVIAASMTIAEQLVPGWLAKWGRICGDPAPETQLLVRNSVDVMTTVLEGKADLGFVEGPTVRSGLRHKTFAHDELAVVVGRNHPWAQQAVSVSAVELANAPLLLRENGSGTRETFADALARVGVELPPGLPQLGSTAALKATLSQGDSVAVISELAVQGELSQGTLVRIPVTGIDLSRQLRLVIPAELTISSGAREFISSVLQPNR